MSRALIPNSTQIPDILLDYWMAELSGAELKVLLYIARRTYGFGKQSDSISIKQMAQGIQKRNGNVLDRGTGLSKASVKNACNSLIERGLLIRTTRRSPTSEEFEESTYRLNLYAPAPREPSRNPDDGEQGGSSEKKGRPKISQPWPENGQGVGQKLANRRPKISQGVGQKLAPQETAVQETDLQETVQETAAATARVPEVLPEPRPEASLAAAVLKGDDTEALVEALVAHEMNRVDARRLAREKPQECRRQLAFLPYVEAFKSGKGAYLRAAIEGGYGPPGGYEEARRREQDRLRREERDRQAQLRAQEEERRRETLEHIWQRLPEAEQQALREEARERCRRESPFLASRLERHPESPAVSALLEETRRAILSERMGWGQGAPGPSRSD